MNLCLLCRAACPWNEALCPGCHADCPRLGPACRRCGNPLPGADLCGSCAARPPPFTRVVAPFRYRYPVDALIRDFKYGGRLACVRFFGASLAQEVATRGPDLPECLLPVPLHWRRVVDRGFNQSLEIARAIGARLDLPVDRHFLRSVRPTPPQVGLTAASRRRNLRGAFRTQGVMRWKRVAVVDDVMTTGATAREISRVLLRAGIEEVEIWAVAHAG